MSWKYEIVVSGEDGKNAILHRNVSVAGKMVDVLYIKIYHLGLSDWL